MIKNLLTEAINRFFTTTLETTLSTDNFTESAKTVYKGVSKRSAFFFLKILRFDKTPILESLCVNFHCQQVEIIFFLHWAA